MHLHLPAQQSCSSPDDRAVSDGHLVRVKSVHLLVERQHERHHSIAGNPGLGGEGYHPVGGLVHQLQEGGRGSVICPEQQIRMGLKHIKG
jgi:hypothetical protein